MAGPRQRRRPILPLVAAAALVLVGAVAVLGGGGPDPGSGDPGRKGRVAAATRAPVARPIPGHEVYGYIPYWEMDGGIADHLAETDLSTVALFSVTHTRDGRLATDDTGFRRIDGEVGQRILDEAHERGARVELVYTSFGSEKNRPFYSDTKAQDRWIRELVAYATERGFDGVNVDVEGLPPDLVPAFGGFVGRLREALRTADPAAQVSVATGASHLGAAMALAASSAGADRIFLMGYDYRTAGSEPGATSPLDRVGDEKDLAWSLDLYKSFGVPVERTLLGLPLYGVTWPVTGPDFGAAARARGDAWVPRRNLDLLDDPTFAPEYEQTESVEFHATGKGTRWTAVYFDSPRSLGPKLRLANERSLAGAGFWAIGYERGLPGYTELIARFRDGKLGE